MSGPAWRIRSGRPTDRSLLASFTCADPTVGWQVDVEQFIRTQLLDWTFDPHAVSGDPRLLPAFVTGERASDVLMSAVMTDVSARVPPRDARVFALVHEDNQRSIALCHRHGLVEEMSRPHPDYRRIVTQHNPQVPESDQF